MNKRKKENSAKKVCHQSEQNMLNEGNVASVAVQQRYHNELIKYQEQILRTKQGSGEDKAA